MFIPFDDMPSNSRVWVYQSDRAFTEQEVEEVERKSSLFIEQWAAHNQPLKASFKTIYDHFLIISVDESFNKASGCSIDASVHLVKELEKELDIHFFDRTKVAFIHQGKVNLESINNLKASIAEGKITEHSMTFNNLVNDKKELQNKWIVTTKDSWLNRYFKAVEQH